MQLYDDRNKTIKLFENRHITPTMFVYNAKSEPEEHDGVEKSEQKFDESIGERVKFRRQKSDELYKVITDKIENVDKVDNN